MMLDMTAEALPTLAQRKIDEALEPANLERLPAQEQARMIVETLRAQLENSGIIAPDQVALRIRTAALRYAQSPEVVQHIEELIKALTTQTRDAIHDVVFPADPEGTPPPTRGGADAGAPASGPSSGGEGGDAGGE
jgi:enamine deaminase RidA (YjgF/YER057c/UK114 family)